jgi:hypothetical protein
MELGRVVVKKANVIRLSCQMESMKNGFQNLPLSFSVDMYSRRILTLATHLVNLCDCDFKGRKLEGTLWRN